MSPTVKSDLLLVLVTLMAAISWMFSREAVLLMPPLLFMAIRFLMAGVLLMPFAWNQLCQLNREQLLRSLRVGLVFGIAMSLWVTGLHLTDHVGESAFLVSLGVVLVPVIARVVFKEKPPLSTWLALPVAVLGLAFLSLENGFQPEPGQLFFVIAAVIFALFYTLNTRAANAGSKVNRQGETVAKLRVPALALTTVALLTVALVTGTLSLITEAPEIPQVDFTAMLWLWIVASALIGTAGRFLVQTIAQSLSSHSHGVVILVVEPVWVALIAMGWFSETMSSFQLMGCGLIFAALLINRWQVLRQFLKTWLFRKKYPV
ncbi:MAG: DMT family transporter [Halomonadaceae bacterium]|nr:MAG: DMT family transporter [Halomonadaceae bacterium]